MGAATGIVVADGNPTQGDDRFFALAAQGTRAADVLQSRASGSACPKAPGSTRLVQP
ncbi:hypothetical protein AB0K15_09210 [Amycolatopsis sp. NPDC049253]|uniref:hypothetical protein n=1 Tax=Amycolatopsis sp. NPDC049253 TaxID=3155274 RepID=UPI003421D42D